MSKLGKKSILLPKESTIKVEGDSLLVSGPKGSQKILFNHNIPFTHSGILASYKSFNKNQTKISLKNSKINFLKSFNISKNEINKNKLKEIFDQINVIHFS